MMLRKIQIVSFQMPFPADYGGVIDVYYKLKALHDSGVYVILHTFIYDRDVSERIKDVVDEVYYYYRSKSLFANFSLSPFIVKTRWSKELVERVSNIGAPVILEGLHTCAILKKLKENSIQVAVRAHNIEHEYYDSLSKATRNPIKKLFYRIESWRLKRFEPVLTKADVVFPISAADQAYLSSKYPGLDTKLVYPFFDEATNQKSDIYDSDNIAILYHGNLNVAENRNAVNFIIDSVLPLVDDKFGFTVAGNCSSRNLIKKISNSGAQFINHPPNDELNRLISSAKVNLLVSFQSTGVKLKLLNALSKSNGVCIVNSQMVPDESLSRFCRVADSAEEIASKINDVLKNKPAECEIKKQREEFSHCFSNLKGVNTILENFA